MTLAEIHLRLSLSLICSTIVYMAAIVARGIYPQPGRFKCFGVDIYISLSIYPAAVYK
jgi:hypothetical protein